MIKIKLPKRIDVKMHRNKKELVDGNKKFEKFFKKIGLQHIYDESQKIFHFKKNDQRVSKFPHIPDLSDLYYLYNLIVLNNRISILEYGTGWSSLIIYKALLFNKKRNKDLSYTRCDNPYSLSIIDNNKKFINISKKRINKEFEAKPNIDFNYSKCEMMNYNGQYSHCYKKHPIKNPDFIYLDAPNQFYVTGKSENFTVNNFAMQPMGCDILKFENFLTPGTIILIDGRSANIRFLKINFKRRWIFKTIPGSDLSILLLDEPTLGVWNSEQLSFYNK